METVKELMVPIEQYATVNQDMTIREAIESLERAQERYQSQDVSYKHRALLVLNSGNQVVGKKTVCDAVQFIGRLALFAAEYYFDTFASLATFLHVQ